MSFSAVKTGFIGVGLLVVIGNYPSFAQESLWIRDVSGTAILENITPQEAREKALMNAYAEALRNKGVHINATQLSVRSETYNSSKEQQNADQSFAELVQTYSEGIITETANERWSTIVDSSRQQPLITYRVNLDVKVVTPSGKTDPNFAVNAALNQSSFKQGEYMRMKISATQDCYVTVFDIFGDSVRLIYPNEYAKNNFLEASVSLTLPTEGLGFVTFVPEGVESSEELIMVVATKEKRDFLKGKLADLKIGYASSRVGALMDLNKWLADMPLDIVTQTVERFEIKSK